MWGTTTVVEIIDIKLLLLEKITAIKGRECDLCSEKRGICDKANGLLKGWNIRLETLKSGKEKHEKKQEIGKRKNSKSQENRKRKTLNRRRKDVKKNRPNSKNKNKNQIKVKEENKDNQIFADLSSLYKQTNKKRVT